MRIAACALLLSGTGVCADISTMFAEGSRAFVRGDIAGAAKSFEECWRAHKQGAEPTLVLGKCLSSLAAIRSMQALPGDAEAFHARAVVVLEKSGSREDLANALQRQGDTFLHARNWRRGEASYLRCLTLRRALYGSAHHSLAETLATLATALFHQGRRKDALEAMQEAESMLAVSASSEPAAAALEYLAVLYERENQFEAAASALERSVASWTARLGFSHPRVAGAVHNLACARFRMKHFSEAETLFLKAADLYGRSLGASHPDVATAMLNYAAVLRSTKRAAEARVVEARYEEVKAADVRRIGAAARIDIAELSRK